MHGVTLRIIYLYWRSAEDKVLTRICIEPHPYSVSDGYRTRYVDEGFEMTKNKNRKRKILARKSDTGRTYAKTARELQSGAKPKTEWEEALEYIATMHLTQDGIEAGAAPVAAPLLAVAGQFLAHMDKDNVVLPRLSPTPSGSLIMNWDDADITIEMESASHFSWYSLTHPEEGAPSILYGMDEVYKVCGLLSKWAPKTDDAPGRFETELDRLVKSFKDARDIREARKAANMPTVHLNLEPYEKGAWKERLETVCNSHVEDPDLLPVSQEARETAEKILDHIDSYNLDYRAMEMPGIFHLETGGIVLEWGTPKRVVTIEIDFDSKISIFDLDALTKKAWERDEIEDLEVVYSFIRKRRLPRWGSYRWSAQG